MDWTHVLGIILGNAAWILPMFFWVRSESRADIRHVENQIDSIRELTRAIHLEVKDFHGRLCALEEKRK